MSECVACGKTFPCGMVDADAASSPCWCTQLPPLPAERLQRSAAARCYCPDCLRELVAIAQPDTGLG